MTRVTLWWLAALATVALLASCGDGSGASGALPEWLNSVYPEPGATAAIPDGVEVRHSVQGPTEDVRLVIADIDVTSYADFEAAKMRYEDGPVELTAGSHTAEVQHVTRAGKGTEFRVSDSYTWDFQMG